jgi:hypothetical protein
MGIADIKKSASATFLMVLNMKEVQMNTSSLSLSLSTPVVLRQWQIRVSCSWLMEWTMLLFIKLCIRKLDWVSEIDVQSVELLPGHLLLYMVPMHLMVFYL